MNTIEQEKETETAKLQARIKNPALVFPDTLQALFSLAASAKEGGVSATILELVHLRASQINGCGVCVDMHARDLKKAGQSDERIFAVAAWRDTPYFTESERAALALTEAATRLSDRADAVPDEIWDDAARHYDEPALAALVIHIALINFWNRINVTTRQVAGAVR
jgi:AhpD family alkylhydroperoxidase